MFINGDDVMRLISAFRVCWLSGRFGGGKTAGAIWIAGWLVQHGYAKKIVSNIPIKGAQKPDVPLEDAVIILDEAWMYVDNWRDVKKYAAFLRKKNLYLLMPSVWPPNPRLRIIEVQRILNLYVAGIPAWIYRWNLYMGSVKEKGRFGLWKPDRIFGMYDTEFIPTDDGGITRAIKHTMNLSISQQGKVNPDVERTPFGDDAAGDERGDNDEAARRIEDNMDRFATLSAEQEATLKRYRRRWSGGNRAALWCAGKGHQAQPRQQNQSARPNNFSGAVFLAHRLGLVVQQQHEGNAGANQSHFYRVL